MQESNMEKILQWFYSKDFSFWQNVGHIVIVVVLLILFSGALLK